MCDKGHLGTPGFGTFSIDDFLYWRGEGTHNKARQPIAYKRKVITIKPIPEETQRLLDEQVFTDILILDGKTDKTIKMYLGDSHTLIEK